MTTCVELNKPQVACTMSRNRTQNRHINIGMIIDTRPCLHIGMSQRGNQENYRFSKTLRTLHADVVPERSSIIEREDIANELEEMRCQ